MRSAMKVVAYVRVSTDAQAIDGLGLDVQRKGIRAWALANGHRVALWASDEGVSGSTGVDTRDGLLDALNAIEDGTAAGLVVYKLDRLARSLTVQEGTLARVWSMGGSVFSVDLGEVPQDDPDDPMRTAMRQMVGVFSQLERGMIAARLRAGRRLKAERGGYAGGGVPLGYHSVDGELVVHEAESETRTRIFELRGQGLSLRAIARVLADEGRATKKGCRWHPETIRLVLTAGSVHC
jgi:DNA invertase Pin-like site-specific DNA recombinase